MNKNIQMKHRNGEGWDNLYPLTLEQNVVNNNGISSKYINGLSSDVVNIYVNGVTGVDIPTNGDITNPFKTIQYAVDQIPKVINYDRFIYVADGVYNEDVKVKSINGAAIVIGRKDGIIEDVSTSTTGLLVRSITFYDCNGLCRVNNFEQYNSSLITNDAFVRFSRCGYGTAHSLRCANSGITVDTVQFDNTVGSVNSCYFNSQNYCIVSKNGGSVRIDSTNTHGSNVSGTGVLAEAGSVFLNGDNNWLLQTSNNVAQSMGGQVNYPIMRMDLTLSNNWVAYDTGTNKPQAVKHNGVVYLQGLIKDGTVGQGVIAFTLPPLWRPQFGNRFYHPLGSDGLATKVLIDVDGNCAVEVSTGQYISLSDIPPFYVGE